MAERTRMTGARLGASRIAGEQVPILATTVALGTTVAV